MQARRATPFLLALVASLSGCADVMQRVPVIGGRTTEATEADLRNALGIWSVSFSSLVTAASDRIRAETKERTVRRNTLIWQLRMIPLARQAAFRPDAQEAYVASLALATAQAAYLESGDGRELFGAQQHIAASAASKLERDVVDVGANFLSSSQLERLQKEVDALVAQHPIGNVFAADALVQGFADPTVRLSFGWVLDLPMVPFRALAGVSDTAQAVHDFNETARQFTETVNDLPHLTRYELELLLYDAEDLETTERTLAAVEAFAANADRMSKVAETLPEEVGAELAARLEDARATIAELDAALARAEALTGPLQHVADRVGDASTQWTTLLGEMRASDGEKSEGRPFDVREYESAAGRIADASREVRSLVADLNGLDLSQAKALVDLATWRAAALIVVFFLALVVYRAIAARLRGSGRT
jgi:hypothetical protein